MINLYQTTAHPIYHGLEKIGILKGSLCSFEPSCSEYTKQAIERFGLLKGTGLGAYRILRCNPLNKGGYDPIPKKTS
ncbi:MAG: membrane protein insertion efficiency factor YidD [Nanoarchaeota archaeon]|nr:membrane protein insertion efficiency factor YidD [Nanoarchaeota archaeon]MBU1030961.1 membrane protein insertion efficiency factor YidD [Nanoarchaeota archaeon]MBU1849886.1 membrane protein insertion efficiency factor YidD [Nanoarchaeota archaeon]